MFRVILLCCFMFSGVLTAEAEDIPEEQAAENETPNATAAAEEILPDAMQHTPQAPDIDFANLRDPFASYLALVAARSQAMLEEQIKRMGNRDREELENFDLSTLKLVGIISMGEDRVAVIQDSTGKGHHVRRGNYMGKNNGRIEKIDQNTLYLVEQVINAAGDIVDNQVTLTLKEVNQ